MRITYVLLRKGTSDRVMLQKSFAYITSMYSCSEFAQVATTDRDDTISIFNRRVNVRKLSDQSTTYTVLRSWVQDDPDRGQLQVICTHVTCVINIRVVDASN